MTRRTRPQFDRRHAPTPEDRETCQECGDDYAVADLHLRGDGYTCWRCDRDPKSYRTGDDR